MLRNVWLQILDELRFCLRRQVQLNETEAAIFPPLQDIHALGFRVHEYDKRTVRSHFQLEHCLVHEERVNRVFLRMEMLGFCLLGFKVLINVEHLFVEMLGLMFARTMRAEHLGFILPHLPRDFCDDSVNRGIHIIALHVGFDGDVIRAM
jgi:hypothetical protein